MASQLITKYRPTTFDEVVGNADAVNRLKEIVRSESRYHGYMFTGPSGVGKTTLARILAKELNAAVTEVSAARDSGVEAARSIAFAAGFTSITLAPNKLFIIDEAHNLSDKAWEPFLWLIEDGPKSAYFAFCTTDPTKIPETISTRCLTVELTRVKPEELRPLIARIAKSEGMTVRSDVLQSILDAANGAPRMAINRLQQGHAARSREEFMRLIPRGLLKGLPKSGRRPVDRAQHRRLRAIAVERYLQPKEEK